GSTVFETAPFDHSGISPFFAGCKTLHVNCTGIMVAVALRYYIPWLLFRGWLSLCKGLQR
ncbi:MAG: hypothetical protein PHX94_07385, partial [Bacteroidales bacterium]|nr:hypothetical protein [Bacteroidales bacterium]